MPPDTIIDDWTDDIEFERLPLPVRLFKRLIVNPLANYLPANWLRTWLSKGGSELAAANWRDPGGWRSMVISYENAPHNRWDRLLVRAGTIPMALRNRRKLATRLIARLLEESHHAPAHALCLGAGPGHIITDALLAARVPCDATLVDLSSDAFEYGRKLAEAKGLLGRVRFVQGDAREVALPGRIDVIEMIGICEYLADDAIGDIARSVAAVMRPGAAVVFNSLSRAHGTDRFLRRVFGLHLIHRGPQEMEALLGPCGFGEFVRFPEPLGVYHVCVARRKREGD